MRWLIGIVLAVLVGTIMITTIGSVVSSDENAANTAPPSTTAAPRTATSAATVSSGAPTSSTLPTSTTIAAAGFTLTEVALHASSTSCWLLIEGRVFDVTTYLRSHPGGSRTITPWCGKEATKAFVTEDGRGEHSSAAVDLLAEYLIGLLVS